MSLWRRWVALLERRQDATSLAMCRLLVGVTVAWHLADSWAHGVATSIWVDARWGGVQPIAAPWLAAFGGATRTNLQVALAVAILAATLMAAGAFTRPATFVTWLAFDRITRLNGGYAGSADRLLVNILFILLFSGCGRALSVDARLRGKSGDAPAWPRWLLIGQLVLMYFASAVQKVSAGWIPGGPADALWFILQQPTWQRAPMRWLAHVYPLTQAATLATWFFELGSPLLLLAFYYRATPERPGWLRSVLNRWDFRRAYLLLGLALHLGIFLTLEIGPFLGAILALYACCLHPSEWRALLRRFYPRGGAVA